MLKNLKLLREEAGMTQKQLAEAIGVSQQAINKYENHNIEPDIETLIRIADIFNTSVDFLISHTDIRHKIEITSRYDLNSEEELLVESYRQLSQRQKNCILTVIDSYQK